MDFIQSLDPMTTVILLAAAIITVLVLFAKFIKGILKLAIIAVMVLLIVYFLRQAGLF